jgi:hypothetical protein
MRGADQTQESVLRELPGWAGGLGLQVLRHRKARAAGFAIRPAAGKFSPVAPRCGLEGKGR